MNAIGDLNLGDFADNTIDAFGDAYEYLMAMYASSAGKSGGEYYTPQEVSELLARITVVGKTAVNKVYDPACGSGSLLLKFAKVLGRDNVRQGFFGQEINLTTYNLARINMFLHDVNYEKFSLAHGDTLTDPQHWDDEPFEAIVSNPPYSIRWEGDANPLLINDPRFAPAGVLAPKSKADLAFTMHILSWLAVNGTAAIVEFPGVLYRGGAHRGRYHGGSGRARGSTTTTVRCGGGSGHGSGVSQRHVHSRRRRNNCQRMRLSPKLNTLTVRGDGVGLGAGGVRRWADARPSRSASSTRVPVATTQSVATARTSQCRATRAGAVRRVRSQCQPIRLSARKPSSIQVRRAYHQAPTRAAGRLVTRIQGSFCPSSQTTSTVPRRCLALCRYSVAAPIQAWPGPGTNQVARPVRGQSGAPWSPGAPASAAPSRAFGSGPTGADSTTPDRSGPAPAWWAGSPKRSVEQVLPGRPPGAGAIGGQDLPGHGQGGAPIQDAETEHHQPIAERGDIQRQRQVAALPPRQEPAQQAGETAGDIDLIAAWQGLVLPIIEPLPQQLMQGDGGAQRAQGDQDRRVTGTPGENGPIDPPGQAAHLGGAQGRQVDGQGIVDRVRFTGQAHRVTSGRLGGSTPLFCQMRSGRLSLSFGYLPLSAGAGRREDPAST